MKNHKDRKTPQERQFLFLKKVISSERQVPRDVIKHKPFALFGFTPAQRGQSQEGNAHRTFLSVNAF